LSHTPRNGTVAIRVFGVHLLCICVSNSSFAPPPTDDYHGRFPRRCAPRNDSELLAIHPIDLLTQSDLPCGGGRT
jgi:hypothetical protein